MCTLLNDSDGPHARRQAGARDYEIEITSEMVEAGVMVLSVRYGVADGDLAQIIAKDIFTEMMSLLHSR